MKSFLFTIALVFTGSLLASAQTEKGRWTVGAQVGDITYRSQYGSRYFSGSLTPSAGYFLANNFVVGAGLPLSLSTGLSKDNASRSRSNSFGLSPFIRYYFGESKLKPYLGASYTYRKQNQEIDNLNQRTNFDSFSSELSPTIGLAYFINRTVALDAGLSYVHGWYDNGTTNYDVNGNPIGSNTYKLDYLTLNVGFQLFFGK